MPNQAMRPNSNTYWVNDHLLAGEYPGHLEVAIMPVQQAKRRSVKAGMPPGSMVYIGEEQGKQPCITLIDYTESEIRERQGGDIGDFLPFTDDPTTTWLNVDGLEQTQVIARFGEYLELHPLLLEDLVNTQQRPKIEDYGDYLFIVLKMLEYDEAHRTVRTEQVSLVLGAHYVVSFQEGISGDVFDPVRNHLRNGLGRLRKAGADYLAYSLMDAIVDNYFTILEKMDDEIEDIEEELVSDPSPETLQAIHRLKREMIMLRRSVWPLREAIHVLERSESPLIQQSTNLYLRDVYDHTIEVIDTIETMRDILSGMVDIYLSGIGNRMNEIMKVLTIFGAIFIPLTFLAGVYGMNFHFMPELGWRWGYGGFWIIALLIAGWLLLYFRRKKWL